MIDIFNSLVATGSIIYSPLDAIRIKTHTSCQWTCKFCHMEGNHFSSPIKNNEAFTLALSMFKEKLGFREAHYTGGEPSIHPHIVDLIKIAKIVGLKVKMTTNGQTKIEQYENCIRAGLEEINVSMHTLDGKILGEMMTSHRNEDWGKRSIDRQIHFINSLKNKVRIKINTCVGENTSEAIKIAHLAFNTNVDWRPMNIIEKPKKSYALLRQVCTILGAKPISALVVKGSSSFRVTMKIPNGQSFNVKLIRPFRLQSMCEGCKIDEESKCFEYAYGPRMEANQNRLMIRNCMHRGNKPKVLSVSEFFNHPIAKELHNKIQCN